MGLSRSSLAGPGYVILNIIRVLNIIVFLDTIAASVALIVKINIVNGFFFFEAVFHVIIVGISSKQRSAGIAIRPPRRTD
jgi:hypothetical protein